MIDIKQTLEGDIDLSSGDVVYAESSQQHQRDVILTQKGEMKHAPDRGVGVVDFLNDEDPEDLLRTIRQQLIKDGMKIASIMENEGKIEVLGRYEDNSDN